MEKPQNRYEQEALINYCINREVKRPKTNIITAMKYLIVLELATLLIAYLFARLLVFVGFSSPFILLHFFVSVLLLMFFLKRFSILFIELYQHYASEEKRRRCTLEPSCSEYSIIVLKKYGMFKAIKKIYIRLFITCNGIYCIDNP
ncbi:MAG: membrane protein insertion efficiency factor YidD [Alphaproteobacteria bacterium]|nr:membrane protein insertion efficiency factor YidD [Alphaproteobacteria bacterium]